MECHRLHAALICARRTEFFLVAVAFSASFQCEYVDGHSRTSRTGYLIHLNFFYWPINFVVLNLQFHIIQFILLFSKHLFVLFSYNCDYY